MKRSSSDVNAAEERVFNSVAEDNTATERVYNPPLAFDAATERVRAMANYAEEMVFWLQCFADAVTMHRSTDEYREARQRSGVSKNSSGLTAEQLLARETQANARWYLMRGKKLAYGSKYTHQMSRWERRLFDKYQRGELQAEYTEARLQIERVAPFRQLSIATEHAFSDMPRLWHTTAPEMLPVASIATHRVSTCARKTNMSCKCSRHIPNFRDC